MLLRKVDTWLSIAFLALGIVMYAAASKYDSIPSRFPILLAVSFGVLAALLFARTVVMARRESSPEAGATALRFVMPGLVTLGMVIYSAVLPIIGFLVPSVLLMFFTGWILGYRRCGVLLLASIGFVLLVYGVFDTLLGVPLPRPYFME